MELKRRKFIALMLATGAGLISGAWYGLRKASPTRIIRAFRSRRYPGRVEPMDEQTISKPGPWAG